MDKRTSEEAVDKLKSYINYVVDFALFYKACKNISRVDQVSMLLVYLTKTQIIHIYSQPSYCTL